MEAAPLAFDAEALFLLVVARAEGELMLVYVLEAQPLFVGAHRAPAS